MYVDYKVDGGDAEAHSTGLPLRVSWNTVPCRAPLSVADMLMTVFDPTSFDRLQRCKKKKEKRKSSPVGSFFILRFAFNAVRAFDF